MGKVGFGGSCHWCTEAIFRSIVGVIKVDQGWISSLGSNSGFSEGVRVNFDPNKIDLPTLISIHLHTHSCTADHSMRRKYRSAVYTYSGSQLNQAKAVIDALQKEFDKPIITQVIPFNEFKINKEQYLDYYYKNPFNQFCETYINPKLRNLLQQFSTVADMDKLSQL